MESHERNSGLENFRRDSPATIVRSDSKSMSVQKINDVVVVKNIEMTVDESEGQTHSH